MRVCVLVYFFVIYCQLWRNKRGIVTIAPSFAIFELFDVQNIVTLKSRLGVIEGHWRWHHSIDCIRVPIRLPL